LKKHFPGVYRHDDIRTFNGKKYKGKIDVLTGGFPCQPFSTAGKQKGKKDLRYLWPEMLRVIREVRPRWVIGENVPGIVNLALDDVCASLEKLGYETWPLIIPAAGVGAVHLRARVWIIACRDARRFSADSYSAGCKEHHMSAIPSRARQHSRRDRPYFTGWPTEPPVCRKSDELPGRMDAIKSLGNAIHPGVAYEIFSFIQQIELGEKKNKRKAA